jgi:site-specific recombinase XerD
MSKSSGATLRSPLADFIREYIAERRAIGYRCEEDARILRRLDHFLAEQGLTVPELPREIVNQWLAKTPHERPRTRAARVAMTRHFARFLVDRGMVAFVPARVRTESTGMDFTPRIFTRAEVGSLLACVDRLPTSPHSPRRHLVMPELFRVLYGCGLRISEALNLTVTDVDLDQGVLLVREGKFGKDRFVPVSTGLADRLRRYAGVLDREGDRGPAFFPKQDGSHYTKRGVYEVFRSMLREAGIPHGGRGRGPRLHDLRHTFATHRLEDWYRQGADLAAKLPVLSTYMGHQSITGTQRYLRLTPALFPDVVASVEAFVGPSLPRREPT